MRRLGAALLAVLIAGAASPAWAKKKPPADDDDDSASDSDDSSSDDSDAKPAKKKADKAKAKASDDDSDSDSDAKPAKKKKKKADASDDAAKPDDDQQSKSDPDEDFKKQDLSGHDLGTKKKTNEFEKDRFYVDKQDTDATENTTLIQGSITETSFYYTESGSQYPATAAGVTPGSAYGDSASNFNRMFTEVRVQTDFRHIKGGNWDGRVDARIRLVDQPTPNSGPITPTAEVGSTTDTTTEPKIQSGLTGQNEYDIRELWLVRNADRSDVFIGRQFVADLAAVKIDGVRIDYAQSSKFTLLGFGGLLPMLGSRSITTDYIPDNYVDGSGNRAPAGRVSVAGGFGAAYRTLDAYGSFGGVVEAPLSSEEPRIFATSTGYWRYGSKLDFYHFAVIDLIGEQAQQGGYFTNVSAGVNYKPNPRLRLTASYNRVDNQTLSIQAGAYLNSADHSNNLIDNEVYLQRLSTNELRGSASAALGPLQRFEVTGALAFKYRPALDLFSQGGDPTVTPTTPVPLEAEKGGEFYASITDRHSVKDMRLGLDVTQTFGLSSSSANYQHTQLFGIRASAAHDIKNGQGEIEGEVAYTHNSDQSIGLSCQPGVNAGSPTIVYDLDACFGDALNTLISAGGSVYYRFNRDWLGVASFYVSSESIERANTTPGGAPIADPSVLGLNGFLRASYRF